MHSTGTDNELIQK